MSDCWIEERLNDHVDGQLAADESAAIERHLDACPTCAEVVSDLRELASLVADLPRDVSPDRDLWEGVAGRIRPDALADRRAAGVPRSRRGALAGLAVAASVVVVALVAWAVRGPHPAAPRAVAPSVVLAEYRAADAVQEGAAEELARELHARRDELSPETVAVVERNLRIINQAIAEAREAMERDEGNVQAGQVLAGLQESRLDLLRTIRRIPSDT